MHYLSGSIAFMINPLQRSYNYMPQVTKLSLLISKYCNLEKVAAPAERHDETLQVRSAYTDVAARHALVLQHQRLIVAIR